MTRDILDEFEQQRRGPQYPEVPVTKGLVIEDRASGRQQPLMLPPGREPQRLSLAPDGRRLAVELLDNGQRRVELFDLGGLLEPDLAPGLRQSGGGPGVAP